MLELVLVWLYNITYFIYQYVIIRDPIVVSAFFSCEQFFALPDDFFL